MVIHFGLFVCGGSLTSGQFFKDSFNNDTFVVMLPIPRKLRCG